MSDPGLPDEDDPEMLAAEYVLGVLGATASARCAARRRTDPDFARLIAAWERRLMPLTSLVPPVAPPDGLRDRIEAAMRPVAAEAPAVSAVPAAPIGIVQQAVRDLRRQLWLWRGLTGASLAVACVLAALLVRQPAPPTASPGQVALLLPPGSGAGGFLVQPVADTIRLDPVRPPVVPAGRDMELWSLAAGTTVPRSLGLLPGSGEVIPVGRLPAGDLQLLVSLEPAGGSPSGLPTGPVVLAVDLHRPR